MSASRTLVLFGSGPGIGNNVASEYASHGFNHVILLARNETRLQEDAATVAKTGSNVVVDTIRLDLSKLDTIPAALKKIDELAEQVDVVFFNAARIKPSEPLTTSVEEIDEDFRTTNLALYVVAQHFIPKLQSLKKANTSAKPAFFVTNSALPWDPVPQLLSLSLVKGSQKTMVEGLARAFGKVVHIALIHVNGIVAPENKNLNPVNIAQKTWGLYESGEGISVHIDE